MSVPVGRFLPALLPLVLLTACGGSSSSSNPDVQITLQAQFQKQILTPSGFNGITTLPARYCYAEIYDATSNNLVASGYLGSTGTGTASVPRGLQVYAQVYADYQVPSADPSSPFLHGEVLNAPLPATYTTSSAFQATPEWSVTSNTIPADQDGTLTITALNDSTRIAGAFNIADQAVTFGAAIRDMDGTGTLRLPDLATYWTTSTQPNDQTRTYPAVTLASASTLLLAADGRAVFSHQVEGLATGAPNTETDEWDDGVLQETFAHLLFADDSYKPDGSSALSLLRRDNDNVYVSRTTPSESTVAFVGGFCDFLAGATRNQSQLLDSYVDASGISQVEDFDLSSHSMVPTADKGEFTRGSIAVSLWGIWQNELGGTASGLQTLWAAIESNTALPDGTGEYNGATLGCYPSYLLGVQSRVSAPTWNAVLNELSLESVPAPTSTYFNSTALWQTVPVPFSGSGALQTYDPSQFRYYDWDQSQAYRFTQGASGTRTITMNPTGGQDFYLELIGPGGWVAGSYDSALAGQPRTLTVPNLAPGVYAVRVRASREDTATGTYGYALSIN
ncbi:MAG: hypothetical protein KGI56_00075 [Acidobacteriota bacterium]|nr:hypothetical protein [Acidobacteriota bacterium]